MMDERLRKSGTAGSFDDTQVIIDEDLKEVSGQRHREERMVPGMWESKINRFCK